MLKLRGFAICANVGLLITVAYLLIGVGGPSKPLEWVLMFFFVTSPFLSLTCFWRERHNVDREPNWLSLVIERKKLEEQARIARLRQPED